MHWVSHKDVEKQAAHSNTFSHCRPADEVKKILQILFTDTVISEAAVVIQVFDASVAATAVMDILVGSFIATLFAQLDVFV